MHPSWTLCAAALIACCAVRALAVAPSGEEMSAAREWRESHLSANQAPFSFAYGGKPSSELLPTWKSERVSKKLDRNRTQHTITCSDPVTGLVVRCAAVEYRDFPAVEWVLDFSNEGKSDTPIIEGIQALDMELAGPKEGFTLHHSLGESNSAKSFAPVNDVLKPDKPEATVFTPVGGRSSDGHMPFFNVDDRSGGVVIAIGWSGQWKASFQPVGGGKLRIQAGQELTHFTLHPGESVRSPRMLLVFWKGSDDIRGNNLFRQVLMAHYMPRRHGNLVFSPICASVNETDADGCYEKPHLDVMPILGKRGIEVFWSDMDPQQWYPGDFPNGTGTWEPDPKKYPRGLKPIGDAARANGLGYLLWFEPERVHPGTKIDKEHPEWVMPAQGEWSKLFRLHDPVARKWLTDYIDVQITAAQLAWLRWDFNIEPLGFWRRNDAPDRQGITEIRHIENLYAMYGDLMKRHPGLVIDLCASGGRRIDFEALTRGLPLWHSDMQCTGKAQPAADQLQNGGLFRWVPMHGCGDFGLEPSYEFRSAMTAGNILAPSLNGHLSTALLETEAAVKRTVAIYKKLRPYMIGDFYPLFPHDASEEQWYGYQFHRPDLDAGFALIFRREKSPDATKETSFKGIDPKATYEISFEDTPEKRTVAGKEFANLTVEIASAPGSVIVYYKRAK